MPPSSSYPISSTLSKLWRERRETERERERERVMRIEEVAMAAGLDRANKRGGGGDPTLGNTGSEA
jgi:hypothetical protein